MGTVEDKANKVRIVEVEEEEKKEGKLQETNYERGNGDIKNNRRKAEIIRRLDRD